MLRYFLASEHFLCEKLFVKTKFPFCQLTLLKSVLSVLKIFLNIQKNPDTVYAVSGFLFCFLNVNCKFNRAVVRTENFGVDFCAVKLAFKSL